MTPLRSATFTLLLPSLLGLAACAKHAEAARADAGTIHLASETDAGRAPERDAGASDDVEPVYAIAPDAPIAKDAARLCAALHDLPEKRRAACCSAAPSVVVTTPCARTLSAALASGAVTLAGVDVDACAAAVERSLEGCDWVGPFPSPPPRECLGVVKGTLAAGARCRSNLECAGALRCAGLSPTTAGTCAAAKADGEPCGGAVDTLAGYTRQADVDARHPECSDRCIKHRCAPAVAEGKACQATYDCREGLQCLGGPTRTCVGGAPPTRAGDACPGGVCGGGLSCIEGRCGTRKAAGESCAFDFECRGGCLKARGAKAGTCGPRCDLR